MMGFKKTEFKAHNPVFQYSNIPSFLPRETFFYFTGAMWLTKEYGHKKHYNSPAVAG